MIIAVLKGGLGNQMFQYAMARRASYVNRADLKLDISAFSGEDILTPRKYYLDEFNVVENFSSKYESDIIKKRGFINLLHKLKPYYKRFNIKEKYFYFDPKILLISDNVCLDGYWQSEKYFKDIEEIIRREFTLKKIPSREFKKICDYICSKESVSLHIRRGDYVFNKTTNKFHGVCPLNYYYKAIELMNQKVKNSVYFIFSDDIEWAKNNLKLKVPHHFVSDRNGKIKDYEEIILISRCKSHIIANSTFSWWGAWLNNKPNKIVIAPKKWFNDISINTSDLIPRLWIRI